VAEKSSTSSSFSSDLGQDLLEDDHHRPQHIGTANIKNSKTNLHKYNNHKTTISFLANPRAASPVAPVQHPRSIILQSNSTTAVQQEGQQDSSGNDEYSIDTSYSINTTNLPGIKMDRTKSVPKIISDLPSSVLSSSIPPHPLAIDGDVDDTDVVDYEYDYDDDDDDDKKRRRCSMQQQCDTLEAKVPGFQKARVSLDKIPPRYKYLFLLFWVGWKVVSITIILYIMYQGTASATRNRTNTPATVVSSSALRTLSKQQQKSSQS
jgi:hypothetical protein